MKKCLIILGLLSWSLGQSIAQQTSVSNVLDIKSAKQTGEIIENNKLVGYFVFFFKERTDAKTSAYEIEVFDDNYNAVKSFEITRPKDTYMMEMVYNGQAFLIFFYDRKTGYEFVTFNKSGDQLGSVKIDSKSISDYDLRATITSVSSGTENRTFYPLGDGGFVRQSITKGSTIGYSLVAYNNDMSVRWSSATPETSKMYESVEINATLENYVTVTKYSRTSALTRKMDLSFLILNTQDGSLVKEIPMGNADEGKETVLKSYFNEASDKIVLIGEFFKPGDDFLKDKSQGIYVKDVDTKGNVLVTKQYKWVGDIDKYKLENMTDEEMKESGDEFTIFFHDVVRSENGHLFLIGEQFKKQVSAGGVAMNVVNAGLGGGQASSNFEIRVANLVVIELDENYEMLDMKIIRKKRTSVYLEPGMGLYGTALLGYYIRLKGGFDYSFTSREPERDEYTVVYTDFDRKEEKGGEKNDVMLGVVHIKGGELNASRVPINSGSKAFWIQPAKPGYISIVEYYKKEKRLDMRLEKITY